MSDEIKQPEELPMQGDKIIFISEEEIEKTGVKKSGWHHAHFQDGVPEIGKRLTEKECKEQELDHSVPPMPLTQDDADELARILEQQELDEKRPLCEPSKRKGIMKLANYKVIRHNGVEELCSTEEVGPGSSYVKATPL